MLNARRTEWKRILDLKRFPARSTYFYRYRRAYSLFQIAIRWQGEKAWRESAADAESVALASDEPEGEEEEMFACDKCEHPMKASEDTCGKCGTKYNLETGDIIEEKKPQPRSRSAAAAGQSGAKIDF